MKSMQLKQGLPYHVTVKDLTRKSCVVLNVSLACLLPTTFTNNYTKANIALVSLIVCCNSVYICTDVSDIPQYGYFRVYRCDNMP